MSAIRKADFFYPGFEHAGIETAFDRGMTRFFCFLAAFGAVFYDLVANPGPADRVETYDHLAGGAPAHG